MATSSTSADTLRQGRNRHILKQCDNCGVAEVGSKTLSVCGKCQLIPYCSRDCQAEAWKSHKKICRIIPRLPALTATDLKLDTEEVLDFNSALNFASKYMSDLERVQMIFKQHHILSQREFGMGYGEEDDDEQVKLKASVLAKFLQGKQGKLESLEWYMEECCEDKSRLLTDEGRVWKELQGLKLWKMIHPVFQRSQILCDVLRRQDLRVLSLDGLILGPRNMAGCSRADSSALAVTIASCKNLVKLSLSESALQDHHVATMLSDLPNLRCLNLQGNLASHLPGGYLTDRTCKLVADTLPNLQALDLSYQRNVTTSGVAYILRSCQHLRELQVSTKMQPSEIEGLLQLSPQLLFFGVESLNGASTDDFKNIIEATGGRTVLFHLYGGLVDPPRLSAITQQSYSSSKETVQEASNRSCEAGVYNEWEGLF